jgi:formate hydrogenlyase subunit 4
MIAAALLRLILPLGLSPLLLGVINRTKAIVAGRKGQPLLQSYFDLAKLLQKAPVYSRTTTWVFRAGPIVGLAALLLAAGLVPFGGASAPLAFDGDMILFVYLLGLLRLFTVLAALDTGSSFEGMGASREVAFSALAEPALLLGLAAIARQTGSLSLSAMYAGLGAEAWVQAGPAMAMLTGGLLIVFLAENARIPVDDPTTHLELTMIHEAMVLDHSGPDLAFIAYGAAVKLWLLAALLVGVVVPVHSGRWWIDLAAGLAGMVGLSILTGLVESSMARWRLLRVPQLLIGAGALSALALVLVLQ